jgi:hypothetical protein
MSYELGMMKGLARRRRDAEGEVKGIKGNLLEPQRSQRETLFFRAFRVFRCFKINQSKGSNQCGSEFY